MGMIDRPGGRCPTNHRFAFYTVFSTRAARESGGSIVISNSRVSAYFNPHYPRASGDNKVCFALVGRSTSTHTTRAGNDLFYSAAELVNRISTHAIREDGGLGFIPTFAMLVQFQSTPPARVATTEHHGLVYKFLFQPRAVHEERRMAMERTIPKSTTHFNPRRLLSGQLSGIPMIWERPFHPRSPACRHQAGSLPISNPCFNPHGPFGR